MRQSYLCVENSWPKELPMAKRKLRVLIAKFGEGYETALLKLAGACSEAGFEVIYTDLQNPQAIVAAAIQEAVDHIGITALPGADIEDFGQIFRLLEENGVAHIRVTAGGFLPDEDLACIKEMGVLDFYPKGSIYKRIDQWVRDFGESTEP
jgi:methylmalonyl-CoA mutase, C-terminal domain